MKFVINTNRCYPIKLREQDNFPEDGILTFDNEEDFNKEIQRAIECIDYLFPCIDKCVNGTLYVYYDQA